MSKASISQQKLSSYLIALRGGLIVSCQVPDGTPIDTPEFIAAQAQTVEQAGAIGIRAQGISNVAAIAKVVGVPIIGLVKRYLDSTPIHITPIAEDVEKLAEAGADIVAIDATTRLRPNGVDLEAFLTLIKRDTHVPILADLDSVESAIIAEGLGCDAVATTLSGYTDEPAPELPNIRLIEEIAKKVKVPVIAEGGFSTPEHIAQAFDAGAWAVCVGTGITNPYLLTKKFLTAIN